MNCVALAVGIFFQGGDGMGWNGMGKGRGEG